MLEVEITKVGKNGASVRDQKIIKNILKSIIKPPHNFKEIEGDQKIHRITRRKIQNIIGYSILIDFEDRFRVMKVLAESLSIIQKIKSPNFDDSFKSFLIGKYVLCVQEKKW